eukprot:CAMPEP_0169399658 /NCGR_PEP_ID=MMETSP1017-20121227/53369_1 /TAXON_ID=342587 /ORGANISM="Karlodinium micrum, Strain CCMP2283" /LENGTH=139 /DNA_ID=CAMNT_0009504879 /DNA_START=39 /DNA_END=458 /DNA_ORIENTATION=-
MIRIVHSESRGVPTAGSCHLDLFDFRSDTFARSSPIVAYNLDALQSTWENIRQHFYRHACANSSLDLFETRACVSYKKTNQFSWYLDVIYVNIVFPPDFGQRSGSASQQARAKRCLPGTPFCLQRVPDQTFRGLDVACN